ncbi:MAG: hypothetical protein ACI8QG_001875 [Flavobacteriales bacterium]|jgi:hypothetical protein
MATLFMTPKAPTLFLTSFKIACQNCVTSLACFPDLVGSANTENVLNIALPINNNAIALFLILPSPMVKVN